MEIAGARCRAAWWTLEVPAAELHPEPADTPGQHYIPDLSGSNLSGVVSRAIWKSSEVVAITAKRTILREIGVVLVVGRNGYWRQKSPCTAATLMNGNVGVGGRTRLRGRKEPARLAVPNDLPEAIATTGDRPVEDRGKEI